MEVLLIICIAAIMVLLYFLFKSFGRSILYTAAFSALIIYIILNPKDSITFTINGAKLFFYSVFPSLFPFLVIINLIFSYGGIDIYSRLFGKIICKPLKLPEECSIVVLASLLCGYPLGARYAARLYELGTIDKHTFERLLNIATNGSPIFIIGTVGTAMLHSETLGYILILSNMLSCAVMGILLPRKKSLKTYYSGSSREAVIGKVLDTPNFGIALKNALDDAVKTCISIGSFVIIFSLIINMIKSSNAYITALNAVCFNNSSLIPMVDGIFLGFIEITNGCSIISQGTMAVIQKLCICSFLIGFSGISITFQVYSFIYKYRVSLKKYMLLKIFQGIISAAVTFVIMSLPLNLWTEDVFAAVPHKSVSSAAFSILILLVLTLPVIIDNAVKRTNCR